ncbi:MAG: GC-type dockerin domain-anchored protein [Phycisphaerales bacterium]
MNVTQQIVAMAAVSVFAGVALAQVPMTNGGFETIDLGAAGALANWNNSGDDNECHLRQVGDGQQPPALVRTGTNSIQIGPSGPATFRSYNTDRLDFNTFMYFDPPISWDAGAIVVRAWYAIPASDPLSVNGPTGIRLDIKGAGSGQQNNASFDPWAAEPGTTPVVSGHTSGQWREYMVRWPARTPAGTGWKDEVEANTPMFFTIPPYPNRCKIVIGRFNGSNTAATGTVFWDDVTVSQEPGAPAACNGADVATLGGAPVPDGQLTADDIIVYLGAFFAGNVEIADLTGLGGSGGPDGQITTDDLIEFLDLFFAGCGA